MGDVFTRMVQIFRLDLMLQLGLVGLAYAYRHPALDRSDLRGLSESDGVMK